MMTKILFFTLILLHFLVKPSFGQIDSLRQNIAQIMDGKKADIGLSIMGFDNSGDTLSFNGSRHYPMLSVYKFHLALAVLHEVDKGNLFLDQLIEVREKELLPNTFSRIKEKHPVGDVTLSIKDLLQYTVSHGDNNGCDVLFKLLGGPSKVNDYIRDIGVQDVSILSTEEELNKNNKLFFENWTSPLAANQLLYRFYTKQLLSQSSTELLWDMLVETSVGQDRIKGSLPAQAIVAHRTGMAGINSEGVNPAFNNIGIVRLPNGRHFAISVFIANSQESNEANAKIMAEVAKLTWDYFSATQN